MVAMLVIYQNMRLLSFIFFIYTLTNHIVKRKSGKGKIVYSK